MEPFIGRERERRALEDAYASRASAFLPIYGRRRVGKSELILRFAEKKPSVYFIGKQAPRDLQIREFLEVAARSLGEPLLASQAASGWREALTAVADHWTSSRKLILALDEFQWMAESAPELPSLIQELWDRRWRDRKNIFLILCGSYVGFMEREVLGKKSPLFGRRTGQIQLKPFSYHEAALFHPRLSLAQKAATYFVCGGIPLYLRSFASDRSVIQNIAHTFLSEFSPLAREADFLLREELREVENYHAVLMALAEGSLPVHEIAKRSGIGDRKLSYYLQNLMELGYVTKRFPLADPVLGSRHVRYVLIDPLLRFWFYFVYPNGSLISQWGPQRAGAELIQPKLEAYFGHCFEDLCREALPGLYEDQKVSAPYRVGEYWDKNVQIDLVGLRQDGVVDLGECKWGAVRSSGSIAEELRAKAGHYPNKSGRSVFLHLFSRESPGRTSEGIRHHDLKDIYSWPEKNP
jgi:AAA+ ATPase superfamily predicted ATPase